MDPSAYMARGQWQVILDESSWNLVELRDKFDSVPFLELELLA